MLEHYKTFHLHVDIQFHLFSFPELLYALKLTIPSTVYFTVSLFSSRFFFLFQPVNNNRNLVYILPSTDTYECLYRLYLCMKKKFIRFSIRSLSLMLAAFYNTKNVCVCSVGTAVMPERKERKKKLYVYGGLTFSVFLLYIIQCYVREFCICRRTRLYFFFRDDEPKRATCDDEAAEQWGKARKIIKQWRVEMKWIIKFYLNRKYVYTSYKIIQVSH